MVLASAAARAEDPSPELAKLIERARRGELEAQIRLSLKYRDGDGIRRDYKEALRWSRRAADQGSAFALDNTGWHYYAGLGVPQDFDIAVGYFKAGAKAGAPWGMYNLGQCYFSGLGVEQDYRQAQHCWQKGAAKGNGAAALRLAMMHACGDGVPPDASAALRWCEKAVALGETDALVLLGELRFGQGEADAARLAWQMAQARRSRQAADLLRLAAWRRLKPEPGKFALLELAHVHQGHNNCGSATASMAARFAGVGKTQYDIKRLCPASPIGTGTDWSDLVAAAKELGLPWRLVTFSPDAEGFKRGAEMLRGQLDAGRPVIIDFTVSDGKGGRAGHTLLVCGYVLKDDLFVLRDPAHFSPGVRLLRARELERLWRSAGYSRVSRGLARPAIVSDGK
jgi:hypothetical protein